MATKVDYLPLVHHHEFGLEMKDDITLSTGPAPVGCSLFRKIGLPSVIDSGID